MIAINYHLIKLKKTTTPYYHKTMSTIKTRAKNFSKEELTILVNFVLENKSKLFGSFSSKLTSSDKEAFWEEIARTISRDHQTIRIKDDVYKRWCNLLVKYKLIICDKLLAAKKTGGGPAEAELKEFELKIRSIKGNKTFEGITGGVDISMSHLTTLRVILLRWSPVRQK